MKPSDFSSQQIGAKIKAAAYAIAPFVAAIIVAIQFTYESGRDLRLLIEAWNDQLAAWWAGVLGVAPAPAPAPAPVAKLEMIEATPAPKAARKPRARKAAVAAPPAPPAAPEPKRPRPTRRAKKALVEAVAA
jgi:hypothetical protein